MLVFISLIITNLVLQLAHCHLLYGKVPGGDGESDLSMPMMRAVSEVSLLCVLSAHVGGSHVPGTKDKPW